VLDKNERIKLHSNDYVEEFEKNQNINRLKRLLNRIEFQPNNYVLDVGCGSGLIAPLICPKILRYVGVDFSSDFIKSARSSKNNVAIKNANFECCDITRYCTENPNTFDLALALDISDHIYDGEWIHILRSIRERLKDKGKIYIHTPNSDFLVEKLKKNNILLKQFPEHIAVRSAAENTLLLEKAGFQNVKLTYLAHYNILRILHPLCYLPLIGKFFRARLFISAIK